jgi:hypothetical protein
LIGEEYRGEEMEAVEIGGVPMGYVERGRGFLGEREKEKGRLRGWLQRGFAQFSETT